MNQREINKLKLIIRKLYKIISSIYKVEGLPNNNKIKLLNELKENIQNDPILFTNIN